MPYFCATKIMGWVPAWTNRNYLMEKKSPSRMKKLYELEKAVSNGKHATMFGKRLSRKNIGLYPLHCPNYSEVISPNTQEGKTREDLEHGWRYAIKGIEDSKNTSMPPPEPTVDKSVKNVKMLAEKVRQVHRTRALKRVEGKLNKLERGWTLSFHIERQNLSFGLGKPKAKNPIEVKRERLAKKLEKGWMGNFFHV